METKISPLLSCTLLLLFLLNSKSLLLVYAHEQSSPMNFFLNSLIGTKKGDSIEGLSQLKHYLSNLGYMSSNTHDNTFDDNLENAIRKYQNFFKLVETGTLDASTVKQMSQPRCGNPDFPRHSSPLEESHYSFFPRRPKWAKRNLTYSFPQGTRSDLNEAIRAATDLWSSVSPLKFFYTLDYKKADIKISFQVGDHGDGSPFDRNGNILAHAFKPSDGRLHYNADQEWINGIVRGSYDLQTVGLHELGHILGLRHSRDKNAIMTPTFGSGIRKGLAQDDINGIRMLYHLKLKEDNS